LLKYRKKLPPLRLEVYFNLKLGFGKAGRLEDKKKYLSPNVDRLLL